MNLLVLRALGIGDLATAVPALRALRAGFPEARIDLAAPGWLAPLARLTGAVDSVVDTTELAPIRAAPPGLAVNLHGRGPQSHRRLRELRPRELWAFACPAASFAAGPPWAGRPGAAEHEVHRWCRMVAWYGLRPDPDDLALRRPSVEPAVDGATIVHPGAKAPERRWPPDRFAAVARALEGRGHTVVVTGGPADVGLAGAVVDGAGLPPDRLLAGATDTGALAALVAAARLVVSGDTGLAHLATAYGIPSVTLFGPVSPDEWGPPAGRPRHQCLWPTGSVRGPVAAVPHPRLLAIGVDDVLGAAGRALAASARV